MHAEKAWQACRAQSRLLGQPLFREFSNYLKQTSSSPLNISWSIVSNIKWELPTLLVNVHRLIGRHCLWSWDQTTPPAGTRIQESTRCSETNLNFPNNTQPYPFSPATSEMICAWLELKLKRHYFTWLLSILAGHELEVYKKSYYHNIRLANWGRNANTARRQYITM